MIIRKVVTFFSAGFLLVSCVDLPGEKSAARNEGLGVPQRFLSGRADGLELVDSLNGLFKDGNLRRQIDLSQKRNPDVAEAAASLEEAGFNTRIARAGLFPSLVANGGGARAQSNSSGSGNNFGSVIVNRYTASLDAQWEVDVWGGVRAGVVAAAATRDAAYGDFEAARQSIAAQTAQAYFDLVAAQELQDLAEEQFESFSETYDLVNRRFEVGTSDLGTVSLAKTDVENSRSDIESAKNERNQAARLLATLTGGYPDASASAGGWPSLSRGVKAGLPSTLLLVRPDVQAAFRRIIAADANVKVAYADLFPSFVLTASGGQQSSTLRDLANSDFNVWSIAANLTAPITAGGQLRAELGAANARAKQALASYRSTVLNAFREVEDGLGSEISLKRQEAATAAALDAAQKAEDRSLRNFESGLSDILDVLETKRRRFDAEEALINLRNLRFQNRVSLALALGKAY